MGRIALLAQLPIFAGTYRQADAGEEGRVPAATPPGLQDPFGRLRRAAERRDLRLTLVDEAALSELLEQGAYTVGLSPAQRDQRKATPGLLVRTFLKAESSKWLNNWNGHRPALVLAKKNEIRLGNLSAEFLDLPIEAGDVLFSGGFD